MVADPREFRHGLLPYLVSSIEEDVRKKTRPCVLIKSTLKIATCILSRKVC